MVRIITANLNGIRSAVNKGFLPWMLSTHADFVCLQEIKAQVTDMSAEMLAPEGYQAFFHSAEKKGYSGVGLYTKHSPDAVITGMGEPDIDCEGRYLELRFGNLSVVSLYLPSGSSGDERQSFKFSVMERIYPYFQGLMQSGRDIVICGDWNIAHQEADLKNWKGNQKNSGFLPEERAWLTRLFNEGGWVDVYRRLHPNTTDACYTWWSNRGQAYAKNVGWRIDYHVATPDFAALARQVDIYKAVKFSDHAPLMIDYEYNLG